MSNPYLPRVNRALAYARVQLDSIDELPALPGGGGALRAEAALNAALLQLWQALRLYWQEIAVNYRIREPVPTLEALVARLEAASLAAAEARELQTLAASDSWLADLSRWYGELLPGTASPAPASPSPAGSGEAVNLIATRELAPAPLAPEPLRLCLVAMEELLARQREGMAEY